MNLNMTMTNWSNKMIFGNFEIHATPHIMQAYCNCGHSLNELSSDFTSSAMFCSKCENVYALKLIKVPAKKLNPKFMEQCRKEAKKG